jgi:Tfp pilus assembly protein PilE
MRGATLIEVMNFVTLGAVVAAIAMYGVARYTRHTKTAEAVSAVTTLAKNAAATYDSSDASQPAGAGDATKTMRHFPPSARTPVPADASLVAGKRYRSTTADWGRSPWKDLNFSIVQPQHYAYDFHADGVGASAKAVASAAGDLDGDGATSSFSLTVTSDAKLNAVVSDALETKNPEE